MPYRVILADDHAMIRQGIKKLIEEYEGVEVAGEAADGLELLDLLKEDRPDLVILDISMPNLRGIEATREIKRTKSGVKILLLTMHKNREYIRHAFAAGADGYLLKEDTYSELFSAIQKIRDGEMYISPLLSGELTDDMVQSWRKEGKHPEETLTNREREILKMISEGKSSREISGLLGISLRTVQHHRARTMNKLGLKKVADLVRYAIRKGYISNNI
jgi:DNA-binding NarL/FixJ family response regulator